MLYESTALPLSYNGGANGAENTREAACVKGMREARDEKATGRNRSGPLGTGVAGSEPGRGAAYLMSSRQFDLQDDLPFMSPWSHCSPLAASMFLSPQ